VKSEIAIKGELSRNTANSREYHSQFAVCNVCYQLKKVPRFRMFSQIILEFASLIGLLLYSIWSRLWLSIKALVV
jgi:hypothetical protein